MPSYTRGQKRTNTVFVAVNELMYFGFKPKDIASLPGVSSSDVISLGHNAASNIQAGKILIIGANAPKPARVTKKLGNGAGLQQTASSYCAYNSISTAQSAGWTLTKTRRSVSLRSPTSPRNSLTAIATLTGGILYCFPMNKADFDAYGAELGLSSSVVVTTDAERNKLVSGATMPYPGKASKLLPNGSNFSSFFSTDKQGDVVQAGYDILSEEKILVGAAPSNP
ncbi:MAG: hypothetical protein KME23_17660 [Goleter apudmare HA4340-LM2]|jgi:hypothetical protein|nr:hypothetical protein [Goleter apudmare HA4340-LM2]MBW4644788.1 hypothetical protein [Goleter apudmare HA4340-LM2]